MTARVAYELNKTKFLLWKDHAHWARKVAVFGLILCGIAGFFTLLSI